MGFRIAAMCAPGSGGARPGHASSTIIFEMVETLTTIGAVPGGG
jgi:hypothetical protein